MTNPSARGITAGILAVIIAVVVALLALAIVIEVYRMGYRSLNTLGTVTGSASLIGRGTLSMTLTAVGGEVVVQDLAFYGPNGSQLFTIGGTSTQPPGGCTLTIYNTTGAFNTWGRQVLRVGQSVTIDLAGSCGLPSIVQVQVVYNSGRSVIIPVGQG